MEVSWERKSVVTDQGFSVCRYAGKIMQLRLNLYGNPCYIVVIFTLAYCLTE